MFFCSNCLAHSGGWEGDRGASLVSLRLEELRRLVRSSRSFERLELDPFGLSLYGSRRLSARDCLDLSFPIVNTRKIFEKRGKNEIKTSRKSKKVRHDRRQQENCVVRLGMATSCVWELQYFSSLGTLGPSGPNANTFVCPLLWCDVKRVGWCPQELVLDGWQVVVNGGRWRQSLAV